MHLRGLGDEQYERFSCVALIMGQFVSALGDLDFEVDSKVSKVAETDFSPHLLAKYQPERMLGSGSFGAAYLVRKKDSGAMYCAKRVRNDSDFAHEVGLLRQVGNNPFVVDLHETIRDAVRNEYYIIMEYCEGGDLREWIKRNYRNGLLTEPVVLQMVWWICNAVQRCHQLQTLHRDLKPENIFLVSGPSQRIKIGDFGVGRSLGASAAARTFCGTLPYMAPEMFKTHYESLSGQRPSGYNFKAEVFSIGCILLDMSNKKGILMPERPTESIGEAAARSVEEDSSVAKPDVHKLVYDEVPADWYIVRRLLPRMICLEAEKRITLVEILTDPEIQRCVGTEPELKWTQNSMQVTRCSRNGP